MASSEYKPHDIPCALCGHGEPSKVPSVALCDLCLQLIERVDSIHIVPDGRQRIALFPVPSDNIERAGWRNCDGKTGVLLLQFRRGSAPGAGNGRATTFRYANVSRQWWQAFLHAESKGSFFHQTVRSDPAAYPFTKIT